MAKWVNIVPPRETPKGCTQTSRPERSSHTHTRDARVSGKRAAEQTLTQAEQCIRLVEEKPTAINNNDLLKAYFKTVKEHKQMLKAKDHEAAQFLIKNEDSQKPATEADAKAVEKESSCKIHT